LPQHIASCAIAKSSEALKNCGKRWCANDLSLKRCAICGSLRDRLHDNVLCRAGRTSEEQITEQLQRRIVERGRRNLRVQIEELDMNLQHIVRTRNIERRERERIDIDELGSQVKARVLERYRAASSAFPIFSFNRLQGSDLGLRSEYS
jgi:hypothetical protein